MSLILKSVDSYFGNKVQDEAGQVSAVFVRTTGLLQSQQQEVNEALRAH